MEYLLLLTLALLVGAVVWYKRGELNPDEEEPESVGKRTRSFLTRGIQGKREDNEVPYSGIPDMPQVAHKPKDPDGPPPPPPMTTGGVVPTVTMRVDDPSEKKDDQQGDVP